ncbi:MAG: hypothetical protein FJZ01_07145 [Candidatus Sericytochromatia bacterium]|nr:hypothetical protein [Candidatus Tanganyikabacteria bacterium]
MAEPDLPPDGPPGPPPPASEDDFPEVRRRLWDLEWRLRRESGSVSDKLAEVLKLVFQAPAWTGEALAEGMMPALADLRRRIVALETKATEGTAPQHPAFVALSERVDILERLVEEGVAAQREAMARVGDRLAGLEGRLTDMAEFGTRLDELETAARDVAGQLADLSALTGKIKELVAAQHKVSEATGIRVEVLETHLSEQAAAARELAEQLAAAHGRIAAEAERLDQETGARQDEIAALREMADATATAAAELAERIETLEERGAAWDIALEETAGDLVARVGHLEASAERLSRELADKVSAAQFAGVSLSMGTQQAAIKDIKAQIAAIRSGGQLPPLSPEDLAAIQSLQAGTGTAVDSEQVQALWDHMGRLEERIAGMMPEFDRLAKDLADSRKGVKGLLANWMELENKLGFYAEKRTVQQLEARIPPAGVAEHLRALPAMEKRVADLETLAVGLQEGLREIAAALTGGTSAEPLGWEDLPEE